MAVIPTRLCDKCGVVETKTKNVIHIDAKRSDGLRIVGDLCTKCLNQLEKEFGLSATTKKRRATFTVED